MDYLLTSGPQMLLQISVIQADIDIPEVPVVRFLCIRVYWSVCVCVCVCERVYMFTCMYWDSVFCADNLVHFNLIYMWHVYIGYVYAATSIHGYA